MREGIIFDVDGTLWDSSTEVAAAWQEILDRYPEVTVKSTREAFLSNMGKPMTAFEEYFFSDLPKELVHRLMDECVRYENTYLSRHPARPYDGVKETIAELARDYPLFIVSNCQKGYIEVCMAGCGIEDYITEWRCFGDNEMPKEANIRLIADRHHLERFYYVGDIEADYRSTVKAHGMFIHAAYGFGEIKDEVPRIANIRELVPLMRTLTRE